MALRSFGSFGGMSLLGSRSDPAGRRTLRIESVVAALRSSIAAASRMREGTLVVSLVILLVLLRSSAFVFGRSASFNSDQAIVGLMAKHLSEFSALPVFFYGQDYMLGVEAWLAAPLFFVAGPSVTALKLPLLAIHVAIALLLLRILQRELHLRPFLALFPVLFFVAAPVRTTHLLLQANGGNVEPLLYVLLLWMLRSRPLAFGAVLGVGFLHREFTAYGFAAILLIEAVDGSLFDRRRIQDKMTAFVSLAVVFQVVEFLRSIGNPRGPGSTAASLDGSLGLYVTSRSCWDLSELPQQLAAMFTANLATLHTGGAGWLWLVLAGTTVVACGRVGMVLWAAGPAGRRGLQFPVYLALVGLFAAVVPAVSRCGVVLDRYNLVALFGIIGVAALYLRVEPRVVPRVGVIAVTLFCAAFNAAAHLRYASDYFTSAPDPRVVLADYLVSEGIRYARGNYWDAYHVSFLTGEQVFIANDFPRIRHHEAVVAEHRHEAVAIGRTPCENGHEVAGFHVCPP